MLLLFVPKLSSQQFTGVVGDLFEPLFQGLAMFFVQMATGRGQRASGRPIARFGVSAGVRIGFGIERLIRIGLTGGRRGRAVFLMLRAGSGSTG